MVEIGDVVISGQGLVVIEAMKIEMIFTSEFDSKVIEIIHNNGDFVTTGDLLVVVT